MLNSRIFIASGHDAVYYQEHRESAVQSTCGNFRNAALLDADRPLGVLPVWVVKELGIDTPTRQVALSVDCERHAVDRRASVSQEDAEFVALHLAEALNHIRGVKPYGDGGDRWRLICYVPSQGRGIALGLKFVPRDRARTHRDEFWVQTVIPQSA